MKRTLYLCGAGNSEGVRLSRRVGESQNPWDDIVLLDDDVSKVGTDLIGVPIIGRFDELRHAVPERDFVQNLVARTTRGRENARARIEEYGVPFASLVSPTVDVEHVDLAPDSIVYHNVTLGPQVSLRESTVVFMGAVVGHECSVGRGCVIASNAVLNARVVLGDHVYVGTNSTILPEITIGDGATIGAGSVVIQDVPAGATVFGVPATIVSQESQAFNGQSTGNGKPGGSYDDSNSSRALKDLEKTIAGIWMEELHVPAVGPDENFFDVGGCSLLALRTVSRINDCVHSDLTAPDFFRFPTVHLLATHLAADSPIDDATVHGQQRAAARRRRMMRLH